MKSKKTITAQEALDRVERALKEKLSMPTVVVDFSKSSNEELKKYLQAIAMQIANSSAATWIAGRIDNVANTNGRQLNKHEKRMIKIYDELSTEFVETYKKYTNLQQKTVTKMSKSQVKKPATKKKV